MRRHTLGVLSSKRPFFFASFPPGLSEASSLLISPNRLRDSSREAGSDFAIRNLLNSSVCCASSVLSVSTEVTIVWSRNLLDCLVGLKGRQKMELATLRSRQWPSMHFFGRLSPIRVNQLPEQPWCDSNAISHSHL